ncbi:hypothetical protein BUALT_Bualt07G0043300 [Buddleja alternifolia]|uniref:Uncharacterized protein n=1 Tax=Buddleja alternifolia TaxID=168488 RepID=A0AAV6XIX0_9LAMI|nr:hypothetical protein BUALT_Bualt07G0043300 [Buddleja alternifolia]
MICTNTLNINSFFSLIKHGHLTTSARTSMKLVFRNGISRTILTGEEIKGENNAPIEVALVDDSTGNIVDVGRESSLIVEIVLVNGEFDASEGDDWTVEGNIVPEMEGKKPLLPGNICVKLQRGVGVVDNIKLSHHMSRLKPRMFRLGARAFHTFDCARVKEGKTNPFTVKDYRNKYKRKHANPSPSDEVWRLVNIGKEGAIHKRLKSQNIFTVQDFLIRLRNNHEELKSAIVQLSGKKWEDLVSNAKACTGMYCYINRQKNTGVVFNIIIRGLYSENQYFTSTMLSENHKAYFIQTKFF